MTAYAAAVSAATADRVDTALAALGEAVDGSISDRLTRLVDAARAGTDNAGVWLLAVAVTGALPLQDDVLAVRRILDLESGARAVRQVLAALRPLIIANGGLDRRMTVVEGGVVVDVGFSATHEHNTGIQRVVRETMARWTASRRAVSLAAWLPGSAALRALDEVETARVVDFNAPDRPRSGAPRPSNAPLVVPWRSDVVVVEVPVADASTRLAALAELSGNRVHLIGYDTIPIVSADMLHAREAEKFASYLTLVKHADSVVGISDSAAREFAGYVSALASQGVTGPRVSACALPAELTVDGAEVTEAPDARPLVLSVGSHEARKNHRALLFAAEVLWREGHDFELALVGRGSAEYIGAFDAEVDALRAAGRAITVRRDADDDALDVYYRRARVMVFPSLQEGYGLPVAEALYRGTPVITTQYGSTAEIARDGGCLLIDPRDDDSLVEALRSVLTDDALVERLRQEALDRPVRTWAQYAEELWTAMMPTAMAGGAR